MSLQKELKLFPACLIPLLVGVGSVLAASKALAAVSSGGLCLASGLFDQEYLGAD